MSKQAWGRSARLNAVVIRSSAAAACSSRSSVTGTVRLGPPFVAKEALAPPLPSPLGARIGLGALDRIKEHTGEGFEIQSVTAGGGDQLAELAL